MKENLFSIGEVSKIKGITIRALRFYDRIGLLKPSRIDPESRYRYYHISQFAYLDIIKAARIMDISPKDLVPYFKRKDSKGLITFLDKHKEMVRQRMNILENTIRGIDEVNKSIQSAESSIQDGEVHFRNISDRFTVIIPFEQSMSMYDIAMAYSRLYLAVNNSGFISTYEDGLLFYQNDKGEAFPAYLCAFVAEGKDIQECHRIPSGNYVCVSYTKETAEMQQNKLWDYLQKHQLQPLDTIQVSLLTNLLAEETEFFELQVRVFAFP